MRPYQIARQHYGESFADISDYFMQTGLVYSDEDLFLMACAVSLDVMTGKTLEAEFADCWFIEFFAGDITAIFRQLDPQPLPYVAYYRGLERVGSAGRRPAHDDLKAYKMKHIRRIVMGRPSASDKEILKAAQKPPLTYGSFNSAIKVILKDKGMEQEAYDSLHSLVENDLKNRTK